MIAAGLIAARFIHYAALMALFGGPLLPICAGEPAAPFMTRLGPWLGRISSAAVLAALLSGIGWFAFAAAAMADRLTGAVDPQVLLSVVRSTGFGPLWLGRLAILLLLALALLAGWRRPAWLTPVLSGLALASLAASGHALAPEGWAGLAHASADAAHLLAAGVWLGALWALGAALAWSRGDRAATDREIGRLLARFSRVGLAAVTVLVASGLVNSWYLVGSLDRLVSTAYGRLLIAKLVLFAAMAGTAALNRYWITPAFVSGQSSGDPRWLERIRRHVLVEQGLGLAVIAIVSLLGTLQTAAET